MSLCYEFLCPYCNSFIADPLAQVLETDLMTILNLRLVPWGNAILDSNNTMECQVAFPSSDFVSFFFFKNVLSKFRCDHLLLWFFGSMGKRNAIWIPSMLAASTSKLQDSRFAKRPWISLHLNWPYPRHVNLP